MIVGEMPFFCSENTINLCGTDYDDTKRKVPCDYANEAVSDQFDAC